MERVCSFSPCRKYRYMLTIIWNPLLPVINFVMLNPSTADERKNDPTVERCERRARRWGYGGVIITNLFAWRSTDPAQLYLPGDKVGPDNDDAICSAATAAKVVVCGWGIHGKRHGRGLVVKAILEANGVTPTYLRLTKGGQPEHPLYIPYDIGPKEWRAA